MKSLESYGRYFEDLEVGMIIEHWPAKTILESDNNLFCLLTMNHHPLHLNIEYANKHQFGKVLVVGTLVFSLIVGMTVTTISGKAIANLEYEYIKHEGPVFIGDTIRAETTVLDKWDSKSKNDRGIVYVETKGINQKNKVILTFRRKVLVQKSTHRSQL